MDRRAFIQTSTLTAAASATTSSGRTRADTHAAVLYDTRGGAPLPPREHQNDRSRNRHTAGGFQRLLVAWHASHARDLAGPRVYLSHRRCKSRRTFFGSRSE